MDKRQRILGAARARFYHYGIKKTTMQEIARDAKVAVGTLYLYFKNKSELVAAGAEEFVARHRAAAEALLESDLPADQMLRDYVRSRFRVAEGIRTSSRHAAELARAVLRVRPRRLREEGLIMWEYITRILERGVAEGRFQIADPKGDAEVFLLSIASFFPNALMEMPEYPTEDELDKVVEWYLATWSSGRGAKAAQLAQSANGSGSATSNGLTR